MKWLLLLPVHLWCKRTDEAPEDWVPGEISAFYSSSEPVSLACALRALFQEKYDLIFGANANWSLQRNFDPEVAHQGVCSLEVDPTCNMNPELVHKVQSFPPHSNQQFSAFCSSCADRFASWKCCSSFARISRGFETSQFKMHDVCCSFVNETCFSLPFGQRDLTVQKETKNQIKVFCALWIS